MAAAARERGHRKEGPSDRHSPFPFFLIASAAAGVPAVYNTRRMCAHGYIHSRGGCSLTAGARARRMMPAGRDRRARESTIGLYLSGSALTSWRAPISARHLLFSGAGRRRLFLPWLWVIRGERVLREHPGIGDTRTVFGMKADAVRDVEPASSRRAHSKHEFKKVD